MSTLLRLDVIENEGDQPTRFLQEFLRRSYTSWHRTKVVLSASTKTQVRVPFDTIQCVIVVPPEDTDLRVYQNLAPSYWTVDRLFAAFDCSITRLYLYSASACTVEVLLGGE